MKTSIFFAALVSILYLAACHKDDNNPSGVKKLLSGYTTTLYKDTVNFEYNADSLLIASEDVEDRKTYDVSGNQLHYRDYRKTESRVVGDASFTLNSDGNVLSGQGNFSYGTPFYSQFSFTYDSEGNMLSKTDTRDNGTIWAYQFTWTNGDITTVKWFNNNNLYLTFNLEYYPNLENKNKLDGNKFLGLTKGFTGNANAHLLKHESTIFAPGIAVTGEVGYTYSLDADGYPKTSTATGITDPSTDILTYHYQ